MIRTTITRTAPRGTILEDYTASLSDVLGAAAGEAFTRNPIPSLRRGIEQADEYGPIIAAPDEMGGATIRGAPPTPMLSPEEANERGAPYGLTYDEETPQGLVDRQIELKRAEVARQAVLRRGRGGIGEGAARFATELLVTATDPLAVASAFVPVVREARFASWAARHGATRARLARGAVEGGVGAALIEPIILQQVLAEQAEYGLLDSLLNVTVGTALGGGLHTIGGAFGDAIARSRGEPTLMERVAGARAETREAALRSSVAQLAEGRQVDVDAILRSDPAYRAPLLRQTDEAPLRQRLAEGARAEPVAAGFELRARVDQEAAPRFDESPAVMARRMVLAESAEQADELGRVDEAIAGTLRRLQQSRRRLGAADEEAPDLAGMSERSTEALGNREGFRRSEQNRSRAMRPFLRRDPLEGTKRQDGREAAKAREMSERLRELETQRAALITDLNRQTRAGVDRLLRPSPRIAAEFEPSFAEDLTALAGIDTTDPARLFSADPEASRRAAEIAAVPVARGEVADSARAETDDIVQQLREIEEALGVSNERTNALLAEADEEIAQAESLGRALRSAALCTVRT